MSAVQRRGAGSAPLHALKEIADSGIAVPRVEEVLAYLDAHADLADALPRLCMAARLSLPSDVQLSLELYRDREADDTYLTLYARQTVYSSDLLNRIEAASEELDEFLHGHSGWVLITTDYRRPS